MTQHTKPYRSKVRDAPRMMSPNSLLGLGKKQNGPESGEFTYLSTGPSFSKIFDEAKIKNRESISRSHERDWALVVEAVNAIYRLACHHMWLVHRCADAQISPVHGVLFPCFHKSLISLYSAFDLTTHGLYGVARPQLRFAFESLMIAKYCSVNHTSDVFDRWIDGLDVYFTNAVLRKIQKPDTGEFKKFWRLLCNTSHSSIFGVQPDLSLREVTHELDLNLHFVALLLQFAYHLLASHIITPTMRYYASRYSDGDVISDLRRRLREIFKQQLATFGGGTLRLLRDYRSTWVAV